ncbi:hypothetical protein Bca4012_098162 [Brassica carinata]
MPRNKGQLSSAGAYNSGTDQDSAQDDSRPEISCKTCKHFVHMCVSGLFTHKREKLHSLFDTLQGELGSDADANSSNYEPATVEEHSALVSLANGDNSNMLELITLMDEEASALINDNLTSVLRPIHLVNALVFIGLTNPLPNLKNEECSVSALRMNCEIWFLAAEYGCMILASAVICNLCKLYAIKMW